MLLLLMNKKFKKSVLFCPHKPCFFVYYLILFQMCLCETVSPKHMTIWEDLHLLLPLHFINLIGLMDEALMIFPR